MTASAMRFRSASIAVSYSTRHAAQWRRPPQEWTLHLLPNVDLTGGYVTVVAAPTMPLPLQTLHISPTTHGGRLPRHDPLHTGQQKGWLTTPPPSLVAVPRSRASRPHAAEKD